MRKNMAFALLGLGYLTQRAFSPFSMVSAKDKAFIAFVILNYTPSFPSFSVTFMKFFSFIGGG